MRSTSFLVLLISSMVLFNSCQNKKNYSKVKLETDLDTVSYYLGVLWARGAQGGGIDELNYEAISKGMQAVFDKDSTIPPSYEMQNYLQMFSIRKMFAEYKTDNEKFLEENAKKDSVITLPSGLQYMIITQGAGPKPQSDDSVIVNYVGKTIDGMEFDNSFMRGQPSVFYVSGLIKGWTEGLQLMNVGSKYRFFIPYKLAYGETGSRRIKPYSTLIFDVELVGIKPSK